MGDQYMVTPTEYYIGHPRGITHRRVAWLHGSSIEGRPDHMGDLITLGDLTHNGGLVIQPRQ